MKINLSLKSLLLALCPAPCTLSLILTLSSLPPALSQIPQGFNYQAIAKDGSGVPIAGQTLPVRISIQSDSLGGTVFWVELHPAIATNSSGLFTLVVGKGARQSGTAATFSAIDWTVTPKYIMTEIDYGGWKTLGSSKMWSVPYAMYSPSTNPWLQNGSNLYYSGGNVGIGTSAPIGSFGLSTDGGGTYLSLINTSTGGRKYLIGSTGLGNGQGEGKFVIWDWDASANRFTIDPSGNVGIGTTTPTFRFQVQGGESRFGYNSGNSALSFTTGFGNSFMFKPLDHALQLQTDHTGNPVIMYLDKSGPIGIGNANPEYILDISGRIRLRAGGGSAGLWLNDAANSSIRSFIGIYDDDHVGFYGVGSSWGMVMNVNNGNVGIGTTNPGSHKLSIRGGDVLVSDATGLAGVIRMAGHSYVGSADWGNLVLHTGVNSGNAAMLFLTENVERMYIAGNGNVGIGVWPTQKLQVAGNILTTGNSTINGTYQGQAASGYGDVMIVGNDSKLSDINIANTMGIIGLQDANQGHIRLGTTGPIISGYNGNVGIGNTTPSGRLSIQVPDPWADDIPLFEVKNEKGIPVFAVYNYGVRVLVDHNTATKAPKGGFQVSSYDYSKAGTTTPLMIINPDSIRFNIDNSPTKGVKGGFSVGSFADAKGIDQDFMYITPQSSINGQYNTFLGYNAGHSNTTGTFNTYIGRSAGYSNTDGHVNQCIGSSSGYYLTNGQGNVFIGQSAGSNITTGDQNVIIGNYAGIGLTGNDSYNIVIGNWAGWYKLGTRKLYIDCDPSTAPLIWGDFLNDRLVINGDSSANPLAFTFYVNGRSGGDYGWNIISDARFKKDINTIDNALSKINQLRGVYFNWSDPEKNGKQQMGFIAQEAIKTIPEVVNTSNGYHSMDYAPITALLVEGMKEQQKIIESQNDRIDRLEKLILELELKIASSR